MMACILPSNYAAQAILRHLIVAFYFRRVILSCVKLMYIKSCELQIMWRCWLVIIIFVNGRLLIPLVLHWAAKADGGAVRRLWAAMLYDGMLNFRGR